MLHVPRRKLILPTRRKLITGAVAFSLCAPAILRAQVPMTGAGVGAPGGGGGGGGNVSVEAVGTKLYNGAAVTSQNYTGITVGSGSHRALAVLINFDNAGMVVSAVSAVWDSGGTNQSMTQLVAGLVEIPYIFGLAAPISGNKTLALSWSGASRIFVDAVSFINVDQTGGATSFPGAQVGSAVATLTVPSAAADMVICCGGGGTPIGTLTGTILYSDNVNGNFINAFASYDVGASPNQTIGSSATQGSIVACDVKNG